VEAALVTLDRLLPGFPAVQVTPQGGQFVRHGRELEPGDFEPVAGSATRDGAAAPRDPAYVRLIDRNGTLLALGTAGRSPGSLHPAVVLV
jgi:hypothetical protein